MNPEDAAAIAARNAEEVERARRAAEANEPGFLSRAADTATQIDGLDHALGFVGDVGGLLWKGVCSVGSGLGTVCDAVDKVVPKID